MKPTEVPEVRTVMVPVCELCIRGAGGECHTPGCSFFMFPAPIEGANSMGKHAMEALDLDESPRGGLR